MTNSNYRQSSKMKYDKLNIAYKKIISEANDANEDAADMLAKRINCSQEEADAAVLKMISYGVGEDDIKSAIEIIEGAGLYSIDRIVAALEGWASQWKDKTELTIDGLQSFSDLEWLTNEQKRIAWTFRARELATRCEPGNYAEKLCKAMIANIDGISFGDLSLKSLMMELMHQGKLITEIINGCCVRMLAGNDLDAHRGRDILDTGFMKDKFKAEDMRAAMSVLTSKAVLDKLTKNGGFLILSHTLAEDGEKMNKIGETSMNEKIDEALKKICEIAEDFHNGEYLALCKKRYYLFKNARIFDEMI
jgi:hypothetical protein